jgi:hypothetical protein
MAKKVYITEKQYIKLQEIIKEENKELEIPVVADQGQDVGDAINNAKENLTNALGQGVADNANFTLKGSTVERRSFSKKTVEESRINRIKTNGTIYSKSEFSKKILKNG